MEETEYGYRQKSESWYADKRFDQSASPTKQLRRNKMDLQRVQELKSIVQYALISVRKQVPASVYDGYDFHGRQIHFIEMQLLWLEEQERDLRRKITFTKDSNN